MAAQKSEVTAEMLANGARMKAILERRAAEIESTGPPTKEQADSVEKARVVISNIEAAKAKTERDGARRGG
jgi:hypothetical protein